MKRPSVAPATQTETEALLALMDNDRITSVRWSNGSVSEVTVRIRKSSEMTELLRLAKSWSPAPPRARFRLRHD